jgi:hypothetical protein
VVPRSIVTPPASTSVPLAFETSIQTVVGSPIVVTPPAETNTPGATLITRSLSLLASTIDVNAALNNLKSPLSFATQTMVAGSDPE